MSMGTLAEKEVERFRGVLESQGGDPWLANARQAGLAIYESLPVPPPPSKERNFPHLHPGEMENALFETRPPNLRGGDGKITAIPLGQALASHSGIVQKHLTRIYSPGKAGTSSFNKWGALNQAVWHDGAFIFIPKNHDLQEPVFIEHFFDKINPLYFPRILIIAEPGSRAVIVDHYKSKDRGNNFCAPVVEILAGENSDIHYLQIQEWGGETHHHASIKAEAERGGRVTASSCMLGGRRTANHFHALLAGEGAQARLYGLVCGNHNQVFEHYTIQEHLSGQTESDLLYKVVLNGEAYSNFDGLIWIETGAKKTNALQTNRNLLLSRNAKADTTPRLEILNDEVHCTHAAAIGPVDEEQLFYLQSRGIPPGEAESLIVEGFFQDLLDKIPEINLRETVRQKISKHLTDINAERDAQ